MSKLELVLTLAMFVVFGLSATRYTWFARKYYLAYLPPGHLVKRHIFGAIVLYSCVFFLIYLAIFQESKHFSKEFQFFLIVSFIYTLHFISIQNMIYAYVSTGRPGAFAREQSDCTKDQGELDVEEIDSP